MGLRSLGGRMGLHLCCGVVLAAVAASPGRAQQATMLTSPQEIAACLCLDWAVNTLSSEMAARRKVYDEKRLEFDALDAEVAAARSRVNIENANEIAAFRTLLDRRNAAQTALAEQATPPYTAAVLAYNRRVDEYNARCGTHTYASQALAQARANLTCPAP